MEHYQYKGMCMPLAEMKQYLYVFADVVEFNQDQIAWLKFNGYPIYGKSITNSLLIGARFKTQPIDEMNAPDGSSQTILMHSQSMGPVRNQCMQIIENVVPDYSYHEEYCICGQGQIALIFNNEDLSVGILVDKSASDENTGRLLFELAQRFLDIHLNEAGSSRIETIAVSMQEIKPSLSSSPISHFSWPEGHAALDEMVESIYYNLAAGLIRAIGKDSGELKPFIGAYHNGTPVPTWLNKSQEPCELQIMANPGEYVFFSDLSLDKDSFIAFDDSTKYIAMMHHPASTEQLLYYTI